MSALHGMEATSRESTTPFLTACPRCEADLNGSLICQMLLSPKEGRDIVHRVATERTVRAWMRAWCPSGRIPGRRAPVVDSREFVLAVETHKAPYGSKPPTGSRRSPLQTKCSNCGAELGGFVARLVLRSMRDVLPEIGAGFLADAVMRWIRSGHLRAYRIQGIRGPVFDAREFTEDFAALRARYLFLKDLMPATESPATTTWRTSR